MFGSQQVVGVVHTAPRLPVARGVRRRYLDVVGAVYQSRKFIVPICGRHHRGSLYNTVLPKRNLQSVERRVRVVLIFRVTADLVVGDHPDFMLG